MVSDRFWGSEILRPKIVFSGVLGCFFWAFREVFGALEAIGDHFGSFRTILFSPIFVDFRRVWSGFVGGW